MIIFRHMELSLNKTLANSRYRKQLIEALFSIVYLKLAQSHACRVAALKLLSTTLLLVLNTNALITVSAHIPGKIKR